MKRIMTTQNVSPEELVFTLIKLMEHLGANFEERSYSFTELDCIAKEFIANTKPLEKFDVL